MMASLQQSYGLFFDQGMKLWADAGDAALLPLNPGNVPSDLQPLIEYAEFWGIPDDGYRIELIKQAPQRIFEDFRETVAAYEDALLEWLAGSAAKNDQPTSEYVVFSFMLQAYDYPKGTD